ncbi:hypothetical protein LTR95_005017, partial [Oleoguttula sp. CCFEE 5521]
MQSPPFIAPAVVHPSSSSVQITSSRASKASPSPQVVPPQQFTQLLMSQDHMQPHIADSTHTSAYTGSVQTQSLSSSTRTTWYGAVQTAQVPQAISIQQGIQQGQYATPQAQTQQQAHGSNAQHGRYSTRQTQAVPSPTGMVQRAQIGPLVQSQSSTASVATGTSNSTHIEGTSTSSGSNDVQRKASATPAFAQGAGVCVGMNKNKNSLTHGQMHAVEQANAMLQQLGLAPAMQMASADFAMQGQGAINIFISPHFVERDWRHYHSIPFRRHSQFAGSTTITGYNTTKWGGGARQAAARNGRKKLAEYDDEVSDHLAQAGKG